MERSLNPLIFPNGLVLAIAIGIERGWLRLGSRAIAYRFDLKVPPCSNVRRMRRAGSRSHAPNTGPISEADLPAFDRRVAAPARIERPESSSPERRNEHARRP